MGWGGGARAGVGSEGVEACAGAGSGSGEGARAGAESGSGEGSRGGLVWAWVWWGCPHGPGRATDAGPPRTGLNAQRYAQTH